MTGGSKVTPTDPPATTNNPPPPTFSEIQPQSPPHTVNPEKPPIAPEPQPQPQPQPQVPVSGGAPGAYVQTVPFHVLNHAPAPVHCPICGARGLSVISYESGNTTHMSALLLCFCVGLGCIPYMSSSFKDVVHSCGNCGTMLAVWHRSGSPGAAEVLVHAMAPAPPAPVTGGVKGN
ncbi:hypothetical protein C7212DRAFT_308166 [Tuber magnatum]|uniref:LITAF domain-containing protein n=1 Tax=Tuber magnatum TaxID=42249 RepID=A0A317T188_9PEZI|nr:hypothetical protein C7212DRAFT_308166 [Tuber magnatum]